MPGINRFCVMATLQAARAKLLGLTIEESRSWGLNRAIFYAAARRGFKGGGQGTESRGAREENELERPDVFMLGDDMAFKELRGGKMLFKIGGKLQTPEDFQRQVASRFGGKFDEVWKDAVRILGQEDRSVLLSQSRFYNEAYRPRRDLLVEKWGKLLESPPGSVTKKARRS